MVYANNPISEEEREDREKSEEFERRKQERLEQEFEVSPSVQTDLFPVQTENITRYIKKKLPDKSAVEKLKKEQKTEAFFRELFIFANSGSESRAQAEAARFSKAAKDDEKKWKKIIDWFVENNPMGQGMAGMTYERVYGDILDRKVGEFNKANFSSGDRRKMFDYAIKIGDQMEAEALMLSIGHSSALTEDMISIYYDRFTPKKLKKDVAFKDIDGQEIMLENFALGTKEMVWFEARKLRRETGITGKRIDMMHQNIRSLIIEGRAKGANVKSEGFAGLIVEAKNDTLGETGRKIGKSVDMYLNQMITDEKDIEATYEFMRRHTRSFEDLIEEGVVSKEVLRSLQVKIETGESDFTTQEKIALGRLRNNTSWKIFKYEAEYKQNDTVFKGIEAQISKMKNEGEDEYIIFHLQKQYDEIKYRVQLANQKLIQEKERRRLLLQALDDRDIESGEIKSLLLDHYSDDFVMIGKKKVYENQVAFEEGVKQYFSSKNERDISRVLQGEHVMALEQEIFRQLQSDKKRQEFAWSTGHWIHGATYQESGHLFNDAKKDTSLSIAKWGRFGSDVNELSHESMVRARHMFVHNDQMVVDDPDPGSPGYYVVPKHVLNLEGDKDDVDANKKFINFTMGDYLNWKANNPDEWRSCHREHIRDVVTLKDPLADYFLDPTLTSQQVIEKLLESDNDPQLNKWLKGVLDRVEKIVSKRKEKLSGNVLIWSDEFEEYPNDGSRRYRVIMEENGLQRKINSKGFDNGVAVPFGMHEVDELLDTYRDDLTVEVKQTFLDRINSELDILAIAVNKVEEVKDSIAEVGLGINRNMDEIQKNTLLNNEKSLLKSIIEKLSNGNTAQTLSSEEKEIVAKVLAHQVQNISEIDTIDYPKFQARLLKVELELHSKDPALEDGATDSARRPQPTAGSRRR